MIQDIYDPLTEYANVFRDRFKEIAESTFGELAAEAKVDVEANRQTCDQIYKDEDSAKAVGSRLSRWNAWRVVLWICVIGGAIVAVCSFTQGIPEPEIGLIATLVVVLALVYLYTRANPKIKVLKEEHQRLSEEIRELKDQAWKQMEPLNRLYDWDVLTRMMTKAVPRLEFDPYFTTQRLADLQHVYNWDGAFNKERSVLYSHSGLINGNPFVICRTKKMEWGSKTYTGTKTIHWTTRERGGDGKYHTVHHTQTLVAEVTAPYPEYFQKTRLIYGNTAAPDLQFYRERSGLADKEGTLSYKWKRRQLRNKARDMKNDDFAMMSNEDFEVAFNTSNRNNNQQHALLFTPLAQQSMLTLLKDHTYGYGDDFDFIKNKMINTIVPEHLQRLNLDMNPTYYKNFDFDKAQKDFYEINAECFRAIYFSLAPLLCIPMYQQIRPQHEIYGRDMRRESAFWEHEALANFWGQSHFEHPDCVTQCILKTEQSKTSGDSKKIQVYAYGYRTEPRLTYISKFGGDGRMHSVPVHWEEYLPVTGTGEIDMTEDKCEDTTMTHRERVDHIRDVLRQDGLDVYRRHIASKCK